MWNCEQNLQIVQELNVDLKFVLNMRHFSFEYKYHLIKHDIIPDNSYEIPNIVPTNFLSTFLCLWLHFFISI